MTEPTLTLKLTEAERDALLESLEHDERGVRTDAHPDVIERFRLVESVTERIRTAKVAGRAASTTVTPPLFNTGNPEVDAFMRRTWKPSDAVAAEKRRTAGMPKPAPLKPRKWTDNERRMLGAFNEMAVRLWRERGHVVIIEGGVIMGDASNVRVLPLGVSE